MLTFFTQALGLPTTRWVRVAKIAAPFAQAIRSLAQAKTSVETEEPSGCYDAAPVPFVDIP